MIKPKKSSKKCSPPRQQLVKGQTPGSRAEPWNEKKRGMGILPMNHGRNRPCHPSCPRRAGADRPKGHVATSPTKRTTLFALRTSHWRPCALRTTRFAHVHLQLRPAWLHGFRLVPGLCPGTRKVEYQVGLAHRLGFLSVESFQALNEKCGQTAKILHGLIRAFRKS